MRSLALAHWLLALASEPHSETAAVSIVLAPCVELDRVAFDRIASAELGPNVAYDHDGRAGTGTVTRVTVTCADDGTQMTVLDPITRKSLVRTIDLQALPPQARPRLLALAVSELVAASWIELEITPDPVVPPVGPEPPADAERAARRMARAAQAGPRVHPWSIGGGFAIRGFTSGVHALPGANIRLHHRPLRHFGWLLDAEVVGRPLDASLGSVDVMLASGAPALNVVVDRKRVTFDAGAGARFGAVWMRGRPGDPDVTGSQFVAAWGGPMLLTDLAVDLGNRLSLEISAELGVSVLPVRARDDARAVIELEGAFVAGAVDLTGRF